MHFHAQADREYRAFSCEWMHTVLLLEWSVTQAIQSVECRVMDVALPQKHVWDGEHGERSMVRVYLEDSINHLRTEAITSVTLTRRLSESIAWYSDHRFLHEQERYSTALRTRIPRKQLADFFGSVAPGFRIRVCLADAHASFLS